MLAVANPGDTPTLSGRDLSPVLADPAASVRGFFDGETKYARYYGVGGGVRRDGTVDKLGKIFDVDADFDDHDHEWYETREDPHELANLANDRGRRRELRALFRRLLDYEAQELTLTP